MSEAFIFLLPPTVMCLILVGIHCYLGIHVLERGVIFVDLALAQLAALGTTIAYLWGYEHEGFPSYAVSLFCTMIAALFLALANRNQNKVSQEAIIGVLYAFGSAAVILLIDRMAHGAEHLKQALVGQLLWVSWPEVTKVFLIYFVVAVIHYIFRKQFFSATRGETRSWIWDFLFYALFGVIITSSVHVAGVLLVFSFLVVPALVSSMFFNRITHRLIFGWALGFILSLSGMILSFQFDVPSGALIVVLFTSVPIAIVLVQSLLPKVGTK